MQVSCTRPRFTFTYIRLANGLRMACDAQDMGLANYAEYFAERGIASLVFDYRTFGGSDGMPRNLVDPWR